MLWRARRLVVGQASDGCWNLPLGLPLAVHLSRKTADAIYAAAWFSYPATVVICHVGHLLNFLDVIGIFLGLFLAMHHLVCVVRAACSSLA